MFLYYDFINEIPSLKENVKKEDVLPASTQSVTRLRVTGSIEQITLTLLLYFLK